MLELEEVAVRLEESMGKVLRLNDSATDKGKQRMIQRGNGGDDHPIWNGLDSRFNHSWTPRGPPISPGLG